MIEDKAPTAPRKKENPLLAFDLSGQSEELDSIAVAQTPLLGTICLSGQVTVIAAPPNAGKTLITLKLLVDAVEENRIAGDDAYYVNADDTLQGVADKVRMLDEYGVHVLAEGLNGFRASMLAPALEQMIEDDGVRGKFLILDTLKKFTQPMSKTEIASFTAVLRRFVLAGGTLLCLAHTNKNAGADGQNVFAGFADIRDDVDAMYVVDLKEGEDAERIALLRNIKRRGTNPDLAAYAYSADPELSYLDRLLSVRETDARGLRGEAVNNGTSDAEVLYSAAMYIHHGPDRGKMEIIRLVQEQTGVPRRRALQLLERFTGEDPDAHKWRFVRRDRGRHAYQLLGPIPDPPE